MEAQFVDEDAISPTMIEHRCEDIVSEGKLEQRYNYIVYHFECDSAYFWARAYLDDVKTVSLHGPFENRTTKRPVEGAFNAAVLAYLKRRYQIVQALGDGAYAPI